MYNEVQWKYPKMVKRLRSVMRPMEPIEFGTYKIDVFGFMVYLHSFNIEVNVNSGSADVASDASEAGTVTWMLTNVAGDKPCQHAETEVRDAVEATCGKDGYSGDTYCKACGTKTATGTAIAATGNHADDNNDGYCDGCDKELEKPDSPDTGDVAISVVAVALVAGVALISFKKKAAKF